MGPADFKDHFSGHAAGYRAHRPVYPDALFATIAAAAPARAVLWDVGCGSGQSSLGFAPWFDVIHAHDPSAAQIAAAPAHPQLSYAVRCAEDSGLDAGSVDVIHIAQALHWLDFDRFFSEVRRVARPGALMIAHSYHLLQISPEIDAAIRAFDRRVVSPYWPPERSHVDAGYRTIPWPFPAWPEPIDLPLFEADWPLAAVVDYLATWSAVQRYRGATGRDPLPALQARLAQLWGPARQPRRIRWPLSVLTAIVRR